MPSVRKEKDSSPKFTKLSLAEIVEGQPVAPGGGLDKHTDRDQRSWVFLNYPKKYFATDRTPKKILSEKQNPKNILQKHYSLAKVKHDIIIMENRAY